MIDYTERLLNKLEDKIKEAIIERNWEKEKKFLLLQSGACAALAAVHMQERADRKRK